MLLVHAMCAAMAISCRPMPGRPAPRTATPTATAVRLAGVPSGEPRIDGALWKTAPAVDAFRQWLPREDTAPTLRTEFRVAYDGDNLYVLVRAFDPRPDSIVHTVSRRDASTLSDEIAVYIDPANDHRTGYEFYVNAAGVQRDAALSADSREDYTWDGVWDGTARIDSLGWVAEFRIPFSQLRFPPGTTHFGLLVDRYVARRNEEDSWPLYRRSRTGIVSQFGVLDGLSDIDGGRHAELLPYVRSQTRGNGALGVGADVRVSLSSNVTVNATIRPDFGQVEADPSVVNLTSIETFYPEQRPFFLDGAATYTIPFNCNAFLCGNEEWFYSRRIGRAPQLASAYGGVGGASAAPILAAAKVTARSDGGVTVGALAAATGRMTSAGGSTIEPSTTYGVARIERDSPDNQSGVSVVTTIVDRTLDTFSDAYLPRTALLSGVTFRHRFGAGQYELWGSASESRIAGSAAAVALRQRDAVHVLQRPGEHGGVDTTRTSLTGNQQEVAVGKYGGAWQFETAYERQSRGYDVNDIGYLQRADQQMLVGWLGYIDLTPRAFYTQWRWNLNQDEAWNAQGARLEAAVNSNAHLTFRNNWSIAAGATGAHLGATVCDHCARGGPAMRSDAELLPWFTAAADPRARVAPTLNLNWSITDGGRSHATTINPGVNVRLSTRVQASLGLSLEQNHDQTQWFGNFQDSGTTRFTFAHVNETTRSVTLRASYAATPKLSLIVYAAPFTSDAIYTDVRALSATPLAPAYTDRFTPYTPAAGIPTQFAIRQLRATSVLRWEFARGSTMYLVWAHDRDGTGAAASDSWLRSTRELFALQPINTVLLKVSYWLAR